jgi:hypothetical protein
MASALSPPATALSFLKALGADQVEHRAGRSLLDHLCATYALLAGWGHDPAVAMAGLMHSIYGTDAFETACLAPTERARVTAEIGEDAERLAYLFSAMKRDAFLADLGADRIASRFGDGMLEVSPHDTRIMCEILFANELDLAIAKKSRARPDKIEKKLGPVYSQLADYLSDQAHNAYRQAIDPANAADKESPAA